MIKFFLENSKLNYFLFLITFLIGIYSYEQMPKELFPNTDLEIVNITGQYNGASINTLDKMIVKDLEDELLSMEEIDSIDTIINTNKFKIVATLKENEKTQPVIDDIDIAIKKYKINLPSDMSEPIAVKQKIIRPIIYVIVKGNEKSKSQIIEAAKKLKTDLFKINGVGEISIFGDNEEIYEFKINERKLEAYNINQSQIIEAINNISYTFPIGTIEDNRNGYFYISMNNGNKSINEFKDTLIKINKKEVYLGDVVEIKKRLKEESTKSYKDNKEIVVLNISQLNTSNAITLVENIKKRLTELQKQEKYEGFSFETYNDKSESIKTRLNTVVSNILFGMILVILTLSLLVSKRLSFVIGLGIPTSFVMAFAFAYYMGYSINIVSLLGLLIALGIVVDDAIVVGENIQRYIEEGMDKREAAYKGSIEMAKPIILASLTTLFAFIPMLMISGEMGKFIMLIPIMVSFLIIASLIEVFIFMPIHAEHTLSEKEKTLSWEKVNKIYHKIILKTVHYKKTFLTLFFIIIPLSTVFILKNSNFQIFPEFDASEFVITGEVNTNNNLETTREKIRPLTKLLMDKKEEYSIKSMTVVIGQRQLANKTIQTNKNMFKIDIELIPRKEQNFIEKYINPYLSFEKTEKGNREKSSQEIANNIRNDIKEKEVDKKIKEIKLYETKAGPIKTDIKISLISEKKDKVKKYLKEIKERLYNIKGVKDISDDAELGIPELKLKINKYGDSLGITEKQLGILLSSLYLKNKKFNIYTRENLIEVSLNTTNENELKKFKDTIIYTPDNKTVRLERIVDFKIVENFIEEIKEEGEITHTVFANVDTNIITGGEVLNKLNKTIEKIKQDKVIVKFGGEKEKQDKFKEDMLKAVVLAVLLITLAMLYMFKDFIYSFIILSVIPFSIIGALIGHIIMGLNLSMPSMIGILGLAGVVINDSIIMLSFIHDSKNSKDFIQKAEKRFRPIMLTSITTLLGLVTLIFFATGQAVILQPIAISLGFGLGWGTIINLLYVPALFAVIKNFKT